MMQLPLGFGLIPDPNAFGPVVVLDLGYGFGACLAVAAITVLVLLPLTFRRRDRPAGLRQRIPAGAAT